MKLISLYIENFGKLHRCSLDFSEGLNTVCEENGWGKSTLASFIKAMFYGLPKSGKRSLDENERQKFTPWQGGTYGGNLVFECTRGKFRVERSFGDDDTFLLTDLSTGLPSSAFSEALGQELFGIDADGFERSVYLSARSLAPSGKNDTVRAKLTGAIEDTNDMGSFERAYAALDNRAKEYKKTGKRGKLGELETEIAEQTNLLREKRARLSEQSDTENRLAEIRGELSKVAGETERAEKERELAVQMQDKTRREADIRRLEAQRGAIPQLFDGPLPSAEELLRQRRLLNEIAVDAADLKRIGLDAREQEELVKLSAAFPTGVPTEETMERQYELAAKIRTEKSRCAAERESAERDIASCEEILRSLPSETELRDAMGTSKSDKPSEAAAKPTRPKLLLPFALIFSAVGAVLLVLGVLQSLLPLTVGGGAALIAGLVCLVLFLVGSGSSKNGREEERTADLAARELLARYGRSAGDDPRRALASLSDERARALEKSAAAHERTEKLRSNETAVREQENTLRAFLAGYGITDADTENGLRRLSEQSRDWERLYRKQRDAERSASEKRSALAEKTAEAERFFARYQGAGGMDAEHRLQAMETQINRYTALGEQIEEQKKGLREFLAEKRLDAEISDAVPTDLAAQNARLEDLRQRRDALSERERALTIALDRLYGETEQIPELEEAIARLKEEAEDASDRYRLLKLTCDYLKEAREALSTRYLARTRESFGKYLSLLTGGDAPQADVNAEFGVTVVDGGMTRQWEAYSRGWRDVLQFCVRLSLVDALFENGEKPFLLLDDPFTNLDGKRISFAKELLSRLSSEFQTLYLVCHEDRA